MLVRDGRLTIQCHLPVSTIMVNSEWVRMGVEAYFNHPTIVEFLGAIETVHQFAETEKKAKGQLVSLVKAKTLHMPTPEEFARAIGFSHFAQLRKAVESTDHPEASRHYLLVGCSIIADMLTRAGLQDRMNAKFVQFIMSAYMGINEKTESYTQSDNHVKIEWGASPLLERIQDVRPLIEMSQPDELDIELDRLERALQPNMQLPVYRATTIEEADA